MGDYYGGYGNNGNSSGNYQQGGAPNFSVPPPAFQSGPGQNYPPPQQGNWGPSGGGSYQGRSNNRGGSNYGSNPRNDSYGGGERKNNFSGGNSNKSGYNKGDAGGDMVTQEDTIFVSGMDPQTTEDDIANHFGAIGIIKKDKKTTKPKIWLYRHKESGESKGEATITYDDSNAAQSAISWFDNKKLNGAIIHVSLAQRQNTWQKGGTFRGGNRGGGRGGPGGPGGNRGGFDRSDRGGDRDNGRDDDRGRGSQGGGNRNQREGDWTCSGCNNTNFAWRNECNRCKEPKAGGNPGNANAGGYRGSQDRGGNRPGQDRGGNFNRRDQGPMRGNGDRNDRNRPY